MVEMEGRSRTVAEKVGSVLAGKVGYVFLSLISSLFSW